MLTKWLFWTFQKVKSKKKMFSICKKNFDIVIKLDFFYRLIMKKIHLKILNYHDNLWGIMQFLGYTFYNFNKNYIIKIQHYKI